MIIEAFVSIALIPFLAEISQAASNEKPCHFLFESPDTLGVFVPYNTTNQNTKDETFIEWRLLTDDDAMTLTTLSRDDDRYTAIGVDGTIATFPIASFKEKSYDCSSDGVNGVDCRSKLLELPSDVRGYCIPFKGGIAGEELVSIAFIKNIRDCLLAASEGSAIAYDNEKQSCQIYTGSTTKQASSTLQSCVFRPRWYPYSYGLSKKSMSLIGVQTKEECIESGGKEFGVNGVSYSDSDNRCILHKEMTDLWTSSGTGKFDGGVNVSKWKTAFLPPSSRQQLMAAATKVKNAQSTLSSKAGLSGSSAAYVTGMAAGGGLLVVGGIVAGAWYKFSHKEEKPLEKQISMSDLPQADRQGELTGQLANDVESVIQVYDSFFDE